MTARTESFAGASLWQGMLELSNPEGGSEEEPTGWYDRRGRETGRSTALGLWAELGKQEDPITRIRDMLLQLLMQRFQSAGFLRYGRGMADSGMRTVMQVNYYEQEQTSFTAQGIAQTEDGRRIEFDVSLEMSRTFVEYTSVSVPNMASVLMDPLVINVDAGVTSLSRQQFRFDLDADGTEEEIAMPTAGSAFLALDRNGDGRINNGSELFGAKTGDGFGELRRYDADGNGWIDENDAVYQKLRVWYRKEDGTDELVDLKKADVGAIFLGEQRTEFALTGQMGQTQAQIRSTGVFLKESGGVGTIQHVDLAVKSQMM
ncbi:MAG: hypothetical protein IJT34_04050 [Butyrivibrio sp.]|nr:hypothetical protein [Butyrivibrio sp.]